MFELHELNENSASEVLWDGVPFLQELLAATRPLVVAFDYETTGLRPFRQGHQIISCGVSAMLGKKLRTVAFPLEGEAVKALWRQVLQDVTIRKVAHNLKFEHTWGMRCLGVKTVGWVWDTMVVARILDNGCTSVGLERQAQLQLGVAPYKDDTAKKLRADAGEVEKHGANALNQLTFSSLDAQVLTRNGLDVLYTYRLYRLQRMDFQFTEANNFFNRGLLALADIEDVGVHVDIPYFRQTLATLAQEKLALERQVWRMPLIRKWRLKFGKKINIASVRQQAYIFFDLLKFKAREKTPTGLPKVDDKVLAELDHPLAACILKIRRLSKVQSTYIEPYLREAVGGVIHPCYNLHMVSSYRSSCSNPNFQNVPVHDPINGPMIRRGILPCKPEHQLGEVDYSGLEVRIAACYHKDPTMITYINDPTKDMHRDMACRCFFLKTAQVTKPIRFISKNSFVFPEFYGAYWKSIAPAMWEAAGAQALTDKTTLQQHLQAHGIVGLGTLKMDEKGYFHPATDDCFYAHIQRIEIWFWTKKFPVYAAWRKSWYDSYLTHGSFKTLTGFRCHGEMRRTEVINLPIQGSAFHCLLWSLIQIQQWLAVNEMETRLIGEIHDSLLFSFHPDEVQMVLKKAQKVMCEDVRRHWPWIIVPLAVEAEIAPPGKSWAEMEPIKI
jgi:DNA polymerase-1